MRFRYANHIFCLGFVVSSFFCFFALFFFAQLVSGLSKQTLFSIDLSSLLFAKFGEHLPNLKTVFFLFLPMTALYYFIGKKAT